MTGVCVATAGVSIPRGGYDLIIGVADSALAVANFLAFLSIVRNERRRMFNQTDLDKYIKALETGKFAWPKDMLDALTDCSVIGTDHTDRVRKLFIQAWFIGIAKKTPKA